MNKEQIRIGQSSALAWNKMLLCQWRFSRRVFVLRYMDVIGSKKNQMKLHVDGIGESSGGESERILSLLVLYEKYLC